MRTNIFWEHYKKRGGALHKDLAFSTHTQRIAMLKRFINRYLHLIKIDAFEFGFCTQAIAYYQRLIKFCKKNNKIKAIKELTYENYR